MTSQKNVCGGGYTNVSFLMFFATPFYFTLFQQIENNIQNRRCVFCSFSNQTDVQDMNIELNDFHLIAVHPRVSLHPGPYHVIEGGNVTLPSCHVAGFPAPVVTWKRSSGQLPQGRAQYNNTTLQISDARKGDSDWYYCSAVNLLGNVEKKTLLVVISLPVFTVKPPGKVLASTGDTLTLNCSATGDPRPVISWKRQGATLPVGRSHRTNDALVIRDFKGEDAGNYICVATSAGVFAIETISAVQLPARDTGKL